MKSIIRKHIKSFIIVCILVFICNILNVIHPYIIKQVVDIDFTADNVEEILLKLFILYMIIHIMLITMKDIRNIKNNKLMADILRDIREKLFFKLLKFKMKTYNKYNSSDIYTRLTIDTENLFDLFFNFSQIIINNIIYIIFMAAMMFFANINIALIGFSTILVVAFSSFQFITKIKKMSNNIYDKRDEENQEFSEMYNKNKITYLFNLQKRNIQKTDKLFDEELKFRKKFIFTESCSLPVAWVIEAIGIYAILYYSLNINSNISLGNIYLVLFYIKQCRGPLSEIFNCLEEMQNCFNSLKRVNKILKENDDEDINKGDYIKDLNGNIEFINVCMKYDERQILNDISFMIKKGSKVTIAGKTGVGKTTLTNVFMRLYDISSGQILINGHDISKVSIASIRDNISYISQTPFIFEDTLRNNITLGNNDISDSEILNIIDKIGIRSIYNKFSYGLDEKIKESKLSLGELQIISFVRAIAHKANIYIFDEPTSNIDLKTEGLIQNLINKISENSTVIIVAHRKSTIQNSDKIIYLKDGKVDMIVNK